MNEEKTNYNRTYQHKINECKHTFKRGDNFGEMGINPYHISILAGKRCNFCRHKIAWVWELRDETNKIWSVGSDCVFNLLNLEEEKKRSYKLIINKIARLKRCRKRYSYVLEFLKQNIEFTTLWDLYQQGKVDLIKNDVYKKFHKIKEDCYQYKTSNCTIINLTLTELKQKCCPDHKLSNEEKAFDCKICCAIEIIRKIEEVGNLNEFWFKKFEELSKLKFLEKQKNE